ncbi:MAG: Nif3-like dinuclear metal center hexameric protein [Wigglesworthia glossinidia]|nr:Nif3-like dinuclear metal center hexameric protein [Wigglesworthia glossinidia]
MHHTTNINLEFDINQKLSNNLKIKDYAFNGLQIKGKKIIKTVIIGVTICQELIEFAILQNADAIIVHHGLFWNNNDEILYGTRKSRLKKILKNNINLYAWHLPLDLHPQLGNNAQFAKLLSINIDKILRPCIFFGTINYKIDCSQFKILLEKKLKRKILHFNTKNSSSEIKKIAWCTGSGHKFFETAIEEGIDAFISGEASESTIYIAQERSVHFYEAGHHATEIGGVKALGKWIKKKYQLKVIFFDFMNPI